MIWPQLPLLDLFPTPPPTPPKFDATVLMSSIQLISTSTVLIQSSITFFRPGTPWAQDCVFTYKSSTWYRIDTQKLFHWMIWSPLLALACMCACLHAQSCPTLCDPVDCSLQAPLSMGFSRQEYWSGLPFPSPGDLPDSGIEPEICCISCTGK